MEGTPGLLACRPLPARRSSRVPVAAAALAAPVLLALVTPGRAGEGAEHLFPGNPSGAATDAARPDNYLVVKRQYALSYNNSRGTPNWVSWKLSKAWLGRTTRGNPFAPDTTREWFWRPFCCNDLNSRPAPLQVLDGRSR
jgi:endonuclease G